MKHNLITLNYLALAVTASIVITIYSASNYFEFSPFEKHFLLLLKNGEIPFVLSLLLASFIPILITEGQTVLVVLFAVAILFLLRGFGVDGPLLAAALKIFAFWGLGQTIIRRFPSRWGNNIEEAIFSGVLGASIYTIIISFISLTGILTTVSLAITFVLTLLISIFYLRQTLSKTQLITSSIASQYSIYIPFLLILFIFSVRTNGAPIFDSIWYGLKLEDSILPLKSIFLETGQINPVHYYPKLFEFLTIDLSVVKDFSYQSCFNSLVILIAGLAIYSFLKDRTGSGLISLLIALSIVTVPAIAARASASTPDALGISLFIVGILSLIKATLNRNIVLLALAFITLLLSTATKAYFLIYSFLPLTFLSILLLWEFFKKHPKNHKLLAATGTILAAITWTIIIMRTWLLTGYPYVGPPELIDLFSAVGFSPNNSFVAYEMNTARVSDASALQRFQDFFFHPGTMPMGWFTWTTTLPLSLLLLAAGFWDRKAAIRSPIIFTTNTILFTTWIGVVSYYIALAPQASYGGAGYYYIPALIGPAFILLLHCKTHLLLLYRNALILLFTLVISLNVILILAANWQIGLGTLRLSLNHDTNDTSQYVSNVMKGVGLLDVYNYLDRLGHCRILAARSSMQKLNVKVSQMYLPCSVETLDSISWGIRGREQITASKDRFRAYLCWSGLTHILMPQEEGPAVIRGIIESYPDAFTRSLTSEDWVLWALSQNMLHCDDRD